MSILNLRTGLDVLSRESPIYRMHESHRLLLIHTSNQARIIDIIAKKVVFALDLEQARRILVANLTKNFLVLVIERSGETTIELRSVHRLKTYREFSVADTVHSVCEIAQFKEKYGFNGILFGMSNGRIARYTDFDHDLTEFMSVQDNLVIQNRRTERIIEMDCDLASGYLVILTSMSRLIVYGAESKQLITIVTPWDQADEKKTLEILNFAVYGNPKNPLLGVLLEEDGDLCLNTARISAFQAQKTWNQTFENRNFGRNNPSFLNFGVLRDCFETGKKSIFLLTKIMQEQLKIEVFAGGAKELSTTFTYDPDDIVRGQYNFCYASISDASSDATNLVVRIVNVFDRGDLIIKDEIQRNPNEVQLLFKNAQNLFNSNFELTLEGEHQVRNSQKLFTLSINKNEKLSVQELYIFHALDQGHYQTIIDVLRERIDKNTKTFAKALKSLSNVLAVYQRVLGDLDYNSNEEQLVSCRGFLQSLTLILNYLLSNILTYSKSQYIEDDINTFTHIGEKSIISEEQKADAEESPQRKADALEIEFDQNIDITVEVRTLKSVVENELFYTKLVLWMQANDFYQLFLESFPHIVTKWDNRRAIFKKYITSTQISMSDENTWFSIDLLKSSSANNIDFSYPTKPTELLQWIRSTPNEFHKKFLIFYIISEELLSSDSSLVSMNRESTVESLCKSFTKIFNFTDEDLAISSGFILLDKLVEKLHIQFDTKANTPSKVVSKMKTREFIETVKEACYFLTNYEIKDDKWKIFVLDILFAFDCGDEVAIFIRGGGVRWSDASNARRLIFILAKYKKTILCYNFVRALVEGDPAQGSPKKYFKDLFFYFLELVIQENLSSQIFKLSLKNYERDLIEEFFEANPQHSNLYVLYLLYQGQIEEALHTACHLQSLDAFILSLLQSKIKELPETIREEAETSFNTVLAPKLRVQDMSESNGPLTTIERFSEEYRPSELPKSYSLRRYKSSKSFIEIMEEEKKRDFHEESLGLLLSESRRGLNSSENRDTQEVLERKEHEDAIKEKALNTPKVEPKRDDDAMVDDDMDENEQKTHSTSARGQKRKSGRAARSKRKAGILSATKGYNPPHNPTTVAQSDRQTRSMSKKNH